MVDTKRAGIIELLEYLEESDFYIAPASSKYHGAHKHGLLEHSLLVLENVLNLAHIYDIENIPKESLSIISLLHDVCKINFYKEGYRNKKKTDDKGKDILDNKGKYIWYQEPYYNFEDLLPLGHGEKSVIMLQKFIPLTNNEIMGIRWHMMSYDDSTKSYAGNLALTNALTLFPIISLIHCADLLSISQIIKKKNSSLTLGLDLEFLFYETEKDLVKDYY